MLSSKPRGLSLRRGLKEMPQQRRSEYVRLIGAFVLIGLFTLLVIDMLIRGWNSRGFVYHLILSTTELLNLDWYALFVVPTGIYVGLIVLSVFDYFKRMQGLLLLFGTSLATLILAARGRLVTQIAWGSATVFPLFFASILIGAVIGGVKSGVSNGKPYQFPRAYSSLFWIVTIVSLAGFVETHLLYQSPFVYYYGNINFHQFELNGFNGGNLFIDLMATGGLITLVRWFTGHESEKKVVIIGPTGSGKTWLMAGLNYFLEDQNMNDPNAVPTMADGAVKQTTEKFRDGNFDGIGSTQTDESQQLQFQFVHGDFLKQRVTVRSLDYAGDALRYLTIIEDSESLEASDLDEALMNASATNNSRDLGKYLSEVIYHADCIGLLVPLDDHAETAQTQDTFPSYLQRPARNSSHTDDDLQTRKRMDSSQYRSTYSDIAKSYTKKDVFLIATMSDIAKTDYEARVGTTAVTEWESFREHVTEQFLRPKIDGILQYLDGDDRLAHPIYFKVDPDDPLTSNGNIKPELHPNDGYPGLRRARRLLNRIGR